MLLVEQRQETFITISSCRVLRCKKRIAMRLLRPPLIEGTPTQKDADIKY